MQMRISKWKLHLKLKWWSILRNKKIEIEIQIDIINDLN